MKPQALINELKAYQEDNEYYPTTNEIIEALHLDLVKNVSGGYSILDCGAGNGKVLTELKTLGKKHTPQYGSPTCPGSCYAIEKSQILLESLPKDIFVVGTDMWSNTIIDKQVDILFSNPPYLEYQEWVNKLVREANARFVYLVMPDRWQGNRVIQGAIEARKATAEIIGNFDFLNSEDRKARAKVNLVRISMCFGGHNTSKPKVDPFELWFDEAFKSDTLERTKGEGDDGLSATPDTKEKIKTNLIHAVGLVEALETLYLAEMDKLLQNYKIIQSLDADIFDELGVNVDHLKKSLHLKIKSLKSMYWQELFSNMTKVTTRLTSGSREEMLSKLTSNTQVDFTVSNAHAVLSWAIKNANSYYDSQLIDVFTRMMEKANVINYKSNQKVFSDNDWLYYRRPKELSHVKLDFRVVVAQIGGLFQGEYPSQHNSMSGLEIRAGNFVNDILTIANNLGFTTTGSVLDYDWDTSGKKEFFFKSLKTGQLEVLAEIRAYKNGNVHIKYNQAFIFALNVEMGRLKGWVHSPKEAASEMDIPLDVVTQHYKTNFELLPSQMRNLLQAKP